MIAAAPANASVTVPKPPSRRLRQGRPVTTQCHCRECGRPFAVRRPTAEFCGAVCRSAFHNRKAARGSALYDVVMLIRYDRSAAESAELWSMLCKMAAAYKAEDDRGRDGRPSWDAIAKIKTRNAHFKATVVGLNVAGCRK